MADRPVMGIHHVTAICGDSQSNVDFYTGVLGLRLVKLTVNFDDPTAYHFYYGDSIGSPGTIMTFFPYPKGSHGARGAGAFLAVTFAVPNGSLDFWKERLSERQPEWFTNAHGERMLVVEDPDGLRLQFRESDYSNSKAFEQVISGEYAIQRIAGVVLGSRCDASERFVESVLQFPLEVESLMTSGQMQKRHLVGDQFVDVLPTTHRSMSGRGTIHHVAFRLDSDQVQAQWLQEFQSKGTPVSEVRDRTYFKSIYFREPGGALLELATDGPGFTVDESREKLGQSLQLPGYLKRHQDELAQALPKLRLPQTEGVGV